MEILDENMFQEETIKKIETENGHFRCPACKLLKKHDSQVTSNYFLCGKCGQLATLNQTIPFVKTKLDNSLPF